MIFIETSFFTKRLIEILPDEEYRQFQIALALNPVLGDIVSGGGGLRKVRWYLPDTGKKGGIRVIYYWAVSKEQIYLLLLYKKTEKENISQDQLGFLKQLVKGEFK